VPPCRTLATPQFVTINMDPLCELRTKVYLLDILGLPAIFLGLGKERRARWRARRHIKKLLIGDVKGKRKGKRKGEGNLRLRGGGMVNSKGLDDSIAETTQRLRLFFKSNPGTAEHDQEHDSHSQNGATPTNEDKTQGTTGEDIVIESIEPRSQGQWVENICHEVESSFAEWEDKIHCKTDREESTGASGSGVESNIPKSPEENSDGTEGVCVEDLGVEDVCKSPSPAGSVWEDCSHLMTVDVKSREKESKGAQDTPVESNGVERKGTQGSPVESESGELIVRRQDAKEAIRKVGNGIVEVWVGCGGSLGESVRATNAWNDGQHTRGG
jgi:hypothetical protein